MSLAELTGGDSVVAYSVIPGLKSRPAIGLKSRYKIVKKSIPLYFFI